MAAAERHAPGPTTIEELDRWGGNPGEIIDGVWVPKYPDGKVTGASFAHGIVVFTIGRLLGDHVRPGAARFAPDLAVEVRSPSDREAKVAEKIRHYLGHGTRAVWDVDPDVRTVIVHRPGALPLHLPGDDPLAGGDVLPGFAVPTSALFAELDPLP